MRFLLRAYGCFYRQAEYPVVLNPEKSEQQVQGICCELYARLFYRGTPSQKIQQFQCYKNSAITVPQKAFALMYSRYINFPENF